MKRVVLAVAVIVLVAVAAWLGRPLFRKPGNNPSRINILLITLDTTRADRLGCYGYRQAETPALDRLAAEGTRFSNAFTHVPLTLPSHATLLTGLLPPEHGLRDNGRGRLGSNSPTLADQFSMHGARTAAFIGSFVLNRQFGLDRGFADYEDQLPTSGSAYAMNLRNPGDVVCDRALAWLGKNVDQPFFAWVHFYDSHFPYDVPEPYKSRHAAVPYDATVAFVDAQVKRLMDFLDRRGLRERTMVIVFGDHGEAFGEHDEFEHGALVYDPTMRVPLIVRLPGRVAAGKADERIAGLADVAPTVLGAMGWTTPGAMSGANLLSPPPADRACYGESEFLLYNYGWAPLRSLTTSRWKYIDCPEPELYDLQADPAEAANLLASQPAAAAAMKARLDKALAQMKLGQAGQVTLDSEAVANLRALGYLAGAPNAPASEPDKARRLNPRTMMPVMNACNKAVELMSAGKPAEVIDLLTPLVARSPNSPPVTRQLAGAYIALGRWADALPYIELALRRAPESRTLWYSLGTALLKTGKPDEAAKVFREALRLPRDAFEPGSPDVPSPVDVMLRLHLGVALMRVGKHDQAVAQYRLILDEQPNSASAQNNLGVDYLEQGAFDKAVKPLEAAYSQLKTNVGVAMNLAEARERAGQADAAIELYREAARLSPADARVLDAVAAAYAEAGRYDQAVEAARKAAELARAAKDDELAQAIEQRAALYAAGKPYRPLPGGAKRERMVF